MSTSQTHQTADTAGAHVELQIGGMTCASCAMRIEKKLNKLEGVEASVNYATEKARVQTPAGYDAQLLIAEVEKTGATLRGSEASPSASKAIAVIATSRSGRATRAGSTSGR